MTWLKPGIASQLIGPSVPLLYHGPMNHSVSIDLPRTRVEEGDKGCLLTDWGCWGTTMSSYGSLILRKIAAIAVETVKG